MAAIDPEARRRTLSESSEWLEADGLGGFASGTALGLRTRRYHALLLVATQPPAGRYLMVNGFDAFVTTPEGTFALTTQRYQHETLHPRGLDHLISFTIDPWPTWTFRIGADTVVQELFVARGRAACFLRWRSERGLGRLTVHPFVSGRDPHVLHRENPAFRMPDRIHAAGPPGLDRALTLQPYIELPEIEFVSDATVVVEPLWYRNFVYSEERARGLDDHEDLVRPATFEFDLSTPAHWIAQAPAVPAFDAKLERSAEALWTQHAERERTRRRGRDPLDLAADAYLVQCGARSERFSSPAPPAGPVAQGPGETVIAGYPWFLDWGRDTFIALRGLTLARGRSAFALLDAWSQHVSSGLLPNRFREDGGPPEYNSVDAALWFIVAVEAFLDADRDVPGADKIRFLRAVQQILEGHLQGTRHGIRVDDDGLLAAGVPGMQLTWMDAKVGDWVVTPRIGKPVEVQALWIHALAFAGAHDSRWIELHARAQSSFSDRFWNPATSCLYDVIDVDHVRGSVDGTMRPNQILAVGGLPRSLVLGERARAIVDAVERDLWTPIGLRTLAPNDPRYRSRYEGGVLERDGAYHQGTVWPWLLGPFVEAWIRVRGSTSEAKGEARKRFFAPALRHLEEAGLGHVSEIADGAWPHQPRGCPFQAWSVAEWIRIDREVLGQ